MAADILEGQSFGWWTVLSPHGDDWYCRCACGSEKILTTGQLHEAREAVLPLLRRQTRTRHGRAHGTPEYQTWQNMIQRCNNPKHNSYPNYGGRGIRVDPVYFSFDRFLADLGPRPSDNHSIERKDPNGHYEPGNVVWATKHIQVRNRRTNRPITFNGETLVLGDWAKRIGIDPKTLSLRLAKGWPIEKALTTPPDPEAVARAKSDGLLTFNGETLPIRDWAKRIGISPDAIRYRLRAGWSIERAITTPPDPYGVRARSKNA